MAIWRAYSNFCVPQTVLVVADDPELAALWSQLFIEKGCHVIAKNVAQAVGMARTLKPQLVLADVHISHLDRLTLCRTLKSASRAAVLIVTPPHPEEIFELYALGVDECLAQPINSALVLVKAMAWIVRQQLPSVSRFAFEALA